ncbi:hypothetical protein [Bradyrhizobium sp. USDA 4473]
MTGIKRPDTEIANGERKRQQKRKAAWTELCCHSMLFFIGLPGVQILCGRFLSRPRFRAWDFRRFAGSGHIVFCLRCAASLGTPAPHCADEAYEHQYDAGTDQKKRDYFCPIEAQGFDSRWIAGANRTPWTTKG